MIWRNDQSHFGVISRVIHWAMAALILGQLTLGITLTQMQPGLANLWLCGLHKTGGLVALGLVALRLGWHWISPPPAPLGPTSHWTNRAAIAVHRLTYLLMLAIPISGWVASSATGIDVMFAGRWIIPPIAPVSEDWEHWGFLLHGALTKILMGMLALHVLGAARRGWQRDGTLGRMIRG